MRLIDIERTLRTLRAPDPPEDLKARCLATIPVEASDAVRVSIREVLKMRKVQVALGMLPLLLVATLLLFPQDRSSHALAATLRAMGEIQTMHWVGTVRQNGEMAPTEMWFEVPTRYASRTGNSLSLDDGTRRIAYPGRGNVAYERESVLSKHRGRGFTGADLLREWLSENGDKPGMDITRSEIVSEGRRLQVIEIEDNTHPSHRGKERILIDAATNLLVGLQSYQWEDGQYVLTGTIDEVEYNVPVADEFPELPLGVRIVRLAEDSERRLTQEIMSVITPKGNKVVVRTVDIAENGDVYVQLGWGLLVTGATLTDDRGQTYSRLNYNMQWRGNEYSIFRPSAPRQDDDPLPVRLTLRADVEFGYSLVVKDAPEELFTATFENIPAPRETFVGKPPFEPFVDFPDWDPK